MGRQACSGGTYARLSEYTEKYLREAAEARLTARETG